jgi:hypothetical protein
MEGTMLRRKHERKVGALGAFSLVTLPAAGCGGSGNNTAIALDPDPKVDLTLADSLWVHLSVYPVASTFASLQQSLTALGMGSAFDPGQGNLSGIYPGAFISDVEYKTVVEVNKTGTVAAGGTSVGIAMQFATIRPATCCLSVS